MLNTNRHGFPTVPALLALILLCGGLASCAQLEQAREWREARDEWKEMIERDPCAAASSIRGSTRQHHKARSAFWELLHEAAQGCVAAQDSCMTAMTYGGHRPSDRRAQRHWEQFLERLDVCAPPDRASSLDTTLARVAVLRAMSNGFTFDASSAHHAYLSVLLSPRGWNDNGTLGMTVSAAPGVTVTWVDDAPIGDFWSDFSVPLARLDRYFEHGSQIPFRIRTEVERVPGAGTLMEAIPGPPIALDLMGTRSGDVTTVVAPPSTMRPGHSASGMFVCQGSARTTNGASIVFVHDNEPIGISDCEPGQGLELVDCRYLIAYTGGTQPLQVTAVRHGSESITTTVNVNCDLARTLVPAGATTLREIEIALCGDRSCPEPSYREIRSDPEMFGDRLFRFSGTVIEIIREDGLNIGRLAMNGSVDDVLVAWHDKGMNIRLGDRLTMLALGNGAYTYETASGRPRTIPALYGIVVTANGRTVVVDTAEW